MGEILWQNDFFCEKQPKSGLGRLIVEVSISHIIRHTHRRGRAPMNE